MKSNHLLLAAFLGLSPVSGLSGPAEDARFIAERHVLCDGSAEKLEALERALFNDLKPGTEKLGAKILDPDRFMQALMGAYSERFLPSLVASLTEAYGRVLTSQELSDLADFYRSTQGDEPLTCAPKTASDPDGGGFWVDGPGAPLLEHQPEIVSGMEQFLVDGFSIIRSSFTMDRMAEIFQDPEIIGFEDEDLRAEVVAAMRQAGR